MADDMELNFKELPTSNPVQWPERSEMTDYDTGYIDVSQLFSYMRQLDLNSFENLLNKDVSLVNSNLEDHTLLQYACEYGLYDFVDLLVRYGADVNSVCEKNKKTCLMLACEKGYYRVVELLIDIKYIYFAPINGETILHTLIQNCRSENVPFTEAASEGRNYFKCLEIILEKAPLDQLNINQQDLDGCTALHYVAQTDNQDLILALLNSGAYIGTRNNIGKPALAYVSPKIFESFLDQCICTNGRLPLEDNYEVIVDYNFLIPPKHRKSNNDIIVDVKSNGSLTRYIPETDPLLYMSKSPELRPLLKHPVLTSFIHLKWHSIRWMFSCSLAFYASFSVLLTVYILGFYNIECKLFDLSQPQNDTDCCNSLLSNNYQDLLYQKDCCHCFLLQNIKSTESILWFTIVTMLGLLLVRQIFQLVSSPVQYTVTVENWLEISLIVVTSLIIHDPFVDMHNNISAIGILVSWGVVWILIERHCLLCTKIKVLKKVSRNFLESLTWCSVPIFVVAVSFYSVFRGVGVEYNFWVPWFSFFNGIILLIMGIYASKETQLYTLPGLTILYMFYLLCMSLITTILFNLLYGMAVSDAQAIRNEAELDALGFYTNCISYIQTMLHGKFVKYCLPKFFVASKTILSYQKTLSPESTPRIRVLPNHNNKVIFAESGPHECSPACFANRRNFLIEESVVKAATRVLDKRVKTICKDEAMQNEKWKMLDEYGQRLQQVEKLLSERSSS